MYDMVQEFVHFHYTILCVHENMPLGKGQSSLSLRPLPSPAVFFYGMKFISPMKYVILPIVKDTSTGTNPIPAGLVSLTIFTKEAWIKHHCHFCFCYEGIYGRPLTTLYCLSLRNLSHLPVVTIVTYYC